MKWLWKLLLCFLLSLDEGDNFYCWGGGTKHSVWGCLKRPSVNCLIHFYKRCVSKPCQVQAAFLQDQWGFTNCSNTTSPFSISCASISSSLCSMLSVSNCPNNLPTSLWLALNATLMELSKLRHSSQLIPLHPKVIPKSLVLFPWKSFFWTDDSPLKPKQNVYSTMYSQAVTHPSTNMAQCCLTSVIRRELVFSTWYGRRQCNSVFNSAWLKEIISTAGLQPQSTQSPVV